LASGAEMLAPSAAPLAVAALLPESIPAWVAMGLGAGSMSWLYGGSQAQQTYERGIKAGLLPEKARAAGIETGAIEAGGEILGTMALGWHFGMVGKGIARAAGMTTLLLPFGLAGHALQARQNTLAGAALEDPNAPKEVRLAAADAVGSALTSEDKAFGAAWRAKAQEAIANGQPVTLDRSFVEP